MSAVTVSITMAIVVIVIIMMAPIYSPLAIKIMVRVPCGTFPIHNHKPYYQSFPGMPMPREKCDNALD